MKFNDFSGDEKMRVIMLGINYSIMNVDRVNQLMAGDASGSAPMGDNLFKPELWTTSNWNWFRELMGSTQVRR